MNWSSLKVTFATAPQAAWVWFTRAAQFWLIQTVLFYLAACMIAARPIGPTDYVRFTYYMIQWQPGQIPTTTAEAKER
jgi:hypothetical protein